MSSNTGLRQTALKGGAYLAGRQVVSIGLKTIGVLLITRALGPAAYGAYVSAFNVYQYALAIGTAGIGVYLLRLHGDVPERAYNTAYSILLGMAIILCGVMEFGRNALGQWVGVEGFEDVAALTILALPLQLLSIPASIRLERGLNYRAVAFLEILGQVCFYLVAVPLVLMHFGPVALGFSWVVQQAVSCVAAHVLSKTYPKFGFDRQIAREIFQYATSYSVTNWIWQLRMLVNPLIVGPVLGAQAVGLIGMTVGLLEMLSIIKTITWRLSVAVLGKFQDDFAKLRVAVNEGMELQLLAVGAILLGFGWTGHVFVPILFGERWAPVMDIYPYIAVSYLTVTPFNMHSATLAVLNRNRYLVPAFLAHIALFAGVAYLAVPKYGMIGYGLGELATLPSYLLMHYYLARIIGSPDYRLTALWWVATVIGLFWAQIGLWAIAVPFLALLLPISLRRLRGYLSIVTARTKAA